MYKIVWKSQEICTFLKILNFNFPHIMLSSTTEKICSSCWLKENFNNKNFSFSFENLRIFEDIRRICNLWRSLKNFWINEDSLYLSSVHFQKTKEFIGPFSIFVATLAPTPHIEVNKLIFVNESYKYLYLRLRLMMKDRNCVTIYVKQLL